MTRCSRCHGGHHSVESTPVQIGTWSRVVDLCRWCLDALRDAVQHASGAPVGDGESR